MKKLLVVDDNPDILEAIELIMATEGFETKTSLKGNEAFPLANKFKPDLIILDYLLSGYDGREICYELKKAEKTSHIPIIMISAHPKAKEAVSECGVDSFLAKPFSVDELLDEVEKYIGVA